MTAQEIKTLSALLSTINTAKGEIESLLESQSPPKPSKRINTTLEEMRKSFITGKITKPSKLKKNPKTKKHATRTGMAL